MSFSILHISDLHRSPIAKDIITNAELISALVGDRDRYIKETPSIVPPNAIVVSGDIIQGVPLGTKGFEDCLIEQYEVAEEFLAELAERFLEGDRARMIIIPGNHDVDFNTSFNSMAPVAPKDLPEKFWAKLSSEISEFRWDSKNLLPYKIIDVELYTHRLAAFWKFFERFYNEVPDLLDVKTGADANLFTLNEGHIGVAAYNSCEGNDCFAYHGMIPKETIAKSHLKLNDSYGYDLLISVWHHNIEGSPYRTDYMNVDRVKEMIGCGFRLGLHGHQHKTQVAPQQIWLSGLERMVVVSAGSLCAGAADLPTGFFRQYNIIEISEDYKSVRVHVRDMATANLFSPGHLNEFGGKSFVDLALDPPINSVGQQINPKIIRRNLIVKDAEDALNTENPERAIELLVNIELPEESYERTILLSAADKMKNYPLILKITNTPTTIGELVQRINAFNEIGDFVNAIKALDKFSKALNLPSNLETDLRKRIITLKQIKQ